MDREEATQRALSEGRGSGALDWRVENCLEEDAMENKRGWVTVFMFANMETEQLQCFILPGTFPADKMYEIGLKTIHPMNLSGLALHVAMKTLTTHEYHTDEIYMDNPITS